jgi:hypothetical protein
VQVEARRAEVRKEVALVALETALSTEEVEELRTSTEAGWLSEQDAERLQAKMVRLCEETLARAQRMLQRARATRDKAELLKVGLEAVRMADNDTLCAIAVHAAAQEGVDMNTRPEAAAGEEPKESWLRVAAEEGFVETVRALVKAGAEVNHVSNTGNTALDGAAFTGKVDAIQALLQAGAEVNHVNNYGITALGQAAYNGHVDVMRALLAAGAEVDHASNNGWTPLWGAARNGKVEVLRALLLAGADINRAANNGRTPLAIAREGNHEAAVQVLVQAGATE